MQTRFALVAAQSLKPLFALGLLLSLSVGSAEAALSSSDRARARDAGIVGNAVLDELEAEERTQVLIVFSVPGAARAATRFSSPARRQQLAASTDSLLAQFGASDFELRRRYGAINALAGSITDRGLMSLLDDPRVLRVDTDEGGTATLAQAIPLVNLDALQTAGFTGQGLQVAVLDSGVDLTHPDLAGAVIAEQCFCSDNGSGCCPLGGTTQSGAGSAQDDAGHGTNVTGIVTSDGIVAPVGGAPDAEIVAIKVLDSGGSFCCSSDVIAGLDWIIMNRPDVDVVNMSLGTNDLFTGDCDNATSFTMAFATAINTLRESGVLSVVASGNERSTSQMRAPACVAKAISVGAVWDSNVGSRTLFGCTDATTQADQVTCWSNSSATTDLVAPGAPITSTRLGGGSSTFSGTSQATPVVTACVAVLLEANPTATANELEAALESSPVVVTDAKNGLSYPRLECTLPAVAIPLLPLGGIWLLAALLALTGLHTASQRQAIMRQRRSSTYTISC